MNYPFRIPFIACLVISVCGGLVPLGLVEAHSGDTFTATAGFAIMTQLVCTSTGDSRNTSLDIVAQDFGDHSGGKIEFRNLDTTWHPDSIDIDSAHSGSLLTIKGSLKSVGNWVKSCIGLTDPKLTITAHLSGSCSGPVETFVTKAQVEVRADNVLQMSSTHSLPTDATCEKGAPGNSNGDACIIGTDKNDNLIGISGNDCIDGKGGNDKLVGLAGNDKLSGGDGKDLLSGGNGNDVMRGGNGADLFQCGSGNDKITDFKVSEGDKKTNDCEQF